MTNNRPQDSPVSYQRAFNLGLLWSILATLLGLILAKLFNLRYYLIPPVVLAGFFFFYLPHKRGYDKGRALLFSGVIILLPLALVMLFIWYLVNNFSW